MPPAPIKSLTVSGRPAVGGVVSIDMVLASGVGVLGGLKHDMI